MPAITQNLPMRRFAGLALAFYLLGASGVTLAQDWVTDSACPDDNHAAFHACALDAAGSYRPDLTADGRPDMSGIWRRRAAGHESLHEHARTVDDFGGPSLVVDPANGIVPIQDWADAKRRQNRAQYVHHNALCRLSGVPVTMYMSGTVQFLQNADTFFVQSEEAHAFRVIPLDGREHIGEEIHLWNGDSVGRWEGNTLVVDTTGQNAMAWLDQRGRFYTDEAVIEERFSLVDADTIHYQATITDPNVYSRPFTIAFAYRRSTDESFEIWEEACFENNELAFEQFMNVGYEIYPGMTGDQARRLRAAWELEETTPEQTN